MKKNLEKLFQRVEKPGRYTGGELNSVVKDKNKILIRYAFCFPDLYEIGMSHLGMKILYSLINERQDAWCERVFAPDLDMEKEMRENNIPLFALESEDSIRDFDIIGFSLMFELCYTTVLNMLDLAGIPLYSKDRDDSYPIICCGGPCTCNPEPVAPFFDVVFLGDGENSTSQLLDLFHFCKENHKNKEYFLKKAAQIKGIYVPGYYRTDYNDDGTVKSVTAFAGAPEKPQKSAIYNLDKTYYPKKFVVPFISIVHDRAVEEIFRGCIRGCRFCQAGFTYRPIREKSISVINEQSKSLIKTTGYDELSLCSLSTSDYSKSEQMLDSLLDWTGDCSVNLSLPSLRMDNFSDNLANKLNKVRRSGLTFAAEAGTQHLRDVINKNITDDDIFSTCEKAFKNGWSTVKLYFMMGLPTETDGDILGIVETANKVNELYYKYSPQKAKPKISISCATFVPKPFTPFEWECCAGEDEIKKKQKLILSSGLSRNVKVSFNDTKISSLESVFARGDRRLAPVLVRAFELGCKFDSWDTRINHEAWQKAFHDCKIDPAFYTARVRKDDEIFPWDHLNFGISKKYFETERRRAYSGKTTPNCRIQCNGCGADKLCGGKCSAKYARNKA